MSTSSIGEDPNINTSERPLVLRPNQLLPEQNENVTEEADSFVSSRENTNFSRSKGFSFANAIKNFFKGIISPVTVLIKNPFMALPMIALGAALAFFVPAAIPLMLVAGIGFSGFELGKGVINFSSSYSNGDAKGMEDSFKDIGAGVIGTVLSVFGIRSTAAIAVEAKAASVALRTGATEVEAVQAGLNAAKEAKSIGLLSAFRENFSMFSGSGLRAAKDSFRLTRVKKSMKLNVETVSKPPAQTNNPAESSTVVRRVTDSESSIFFNSEVTAVKAEPLPPTINRFCEQLSGEHIKKVASEIYSEEIAKLAKNLGLSKKKLEKIIPRIDFSFKHDIAGGGICDNFISGKSCIQACTSEL